MEFLWEVGVGADPLTLELADIRGYGLYNDTQSITLEVPVFSIGYTYEVRAPHSYMDTSPRLAVKPDLNLCMKWLPWDCKPVLAFMVLCW